MKRFPFDIGGVLAVCLVLIAITNACHATHHNRFAEGGAPPTMTAGGAPSSSDDGAGAGGWAGYHFPGLDAGASDATDEGITDPCGSQCGPVELCDTAHLGFDDNCNGQVDEGCSCSPGAVHWCFKGDPSYRNAPGCFDGTETCSELGTWGPCVGGVQGVAPDNCFLNDTTACHAITALPFAITDLKTGTGNFSANAVPGSESYAMQCPAGVFCPGVLPPESFQALQSGQYLVTYSKSVADTPTPLSCRFGLYVGARGLRIELAWNHPILLSPGATGVDLDLHLGAPLSLLPWALLGGGSQDCGWDTCAYAEIAGVVKATPPHWFADSNVVPDPVNWSVDPVAANNTCYSDPLGVGGLWAQLGMGCHNPRLDVDNKNCDPAVTDPQAPTFCTPENINIDYPPMNQWMRIGVHYYFNHGETYDVHPEVKVFCDGALSADLGPQGYYSAADAGPDAGAQAVTFQASQGGPEAGKGNAFWIVGDVAFTTDSCGHRACVVQPIYLDATARTPLIMTDTLAEQVFAPPYPPPPNAADAGTDGAP